MELKQITKSLGIFSHQTGRKTARCLRNAHGRTRLETPTRTSSQTDCFAFFYSKGKVTVRGLGILKTQQQIRSLN
jgi:transcription-repair coupling factor (superfamily II helicase)